MNKWRRAGARRSDAADPGARPDDSDDSGADDSGADDRESSGVTEGAPEGDDTAPEGNDTAEEDDSSASGRTRGGRTRREGRGKRRRRGGRGEGRRRGRRRDRRDGTGGGQADDTTSNGRSSGRHLPVAIAVGTGLAAVFVGALFYHPVAFVAVIGLMTTIAYAESGRVLVRAGHRIDVPVLIVATFVMLFGAYHAGHAGQVIGALVLIGGTFVWHMADPVRIDVVRSSASTVLFGLWVGFLSSFAVLLVNRPIGGVVAVLAVIGAAVLGDIGAFAVGVSFGRHRIAPTLSPNKSWEGLAGGVVLATVGGAVGLPMLVGPFDALSGGIVAFACALAAFGGDLVESMVKRDLGLKDLGEVLPGHGGILDRVDGILLALPVGFYMVELLT